MRHIHKKQRSFPDTNTTSDTSHLVGTQGTHDWGRCQVWFHNLWSLRSWKTSCSWSPGWDDHHSIFSADNDTCTMVRRKLRNSTVTQPSMFGHLCWKGIHPQEWMIIRPLDVEEIFSWAERPGACNTRFKDLSEENTALLRNPTEAHCQQIFPLFTGVRHSRTEFSADILHAFCSSKYQNSFSPRTSQLHFQSQPEPGWQKCESSKM